MSIGAIVFGADPGVVGRSITVNNQRSRSSSCRTVLPGRPRSMSARRRIRRPRSARRGNPAPGRPRPCRRRHAAQGPRKRQVEHQAREGHSSEGVEIIRSTPSPPCGPPRSTRWAHRSRPRHATAASGTRDAASDRSGRWRRRAGLTMVSGARSECDQPVGSNRALLMRSGTASHCATPEVARLLMTHSDRPASWAALRAGRPPATLGHSTVALNRG